jgi:hypothetical protein
VPGRGREASARIARQLREAFAALLDQRTAFGRLALTHVVLIAGDTLVTISLASSLFFSISPDAAKGKVILYLVLTMTPFAVVAPLLGPIIDRSRGARRAMVVVSATCRALMCVVMAGSLGSLLLFPEAFIMLVLSKVYLVTKGSLVPLVVAPEGTPMDVGRPPGAERDRLATANARLGLLASLAGFAASLPAIAVLELVGGPWVLRLDTVVFAVGTVAALRLPVGRYAVPRWPVSDPEGRFSTRRSGRAPVAADPWDAPSPPPPGPDARQPVAAAAPAWSGGPVLRPAAAAIPRAVTATTGPRGDETPIGALGPSVTTHPEVILALSAMSILRGLVGFLTFLLAFSLRRMHTTHVTTWLGVMLAGSTAGALVGVMLVPRVRRYLSEPQMLAVSIWAVALAGAVAAVAGGILVQALLSFVIGMASAAAKPAFDALVQRYVPTAAQGRAFARFETRLQLVWVLGALLPVVTNLPLIGGDAVIAAVAAVSGLSYLTSRRALRHRWTVPAPPRQARSAVP